jgi:hypothetical protein
MLLLAEVVPKADHALPFHFAMWFAGVPLAFVNPPAAYTSLPLNTIAFIVLFTPLPSAAQFPPVVSPTAILFAVRIPVWVNEPPAYNTPPLPINVFTVLVNPFPNADQALPFHFATLLAGFPPAVVNDPPA